MQKPNTQNRNNQTVKIKDIEPTIIPDKLTSTALEKPKQQIHYMGTGSTSDGGYKPSLDALAGQGKRIVCMQLTREHLIVVTE